MKTIKVTIEVDGHTQVCSCTVPDYLAHRVTGAVIAQVQDPDDTSLAMHIEEEYEWCISALAPDDWARRIARVLPPDPSHSAIVAAINVMQGVW